MGSVFFDLPPSDQIAVFADGGIGVSKPNTQRTEVNVSGSPHTQTRTIETQDVYAFAFKLSGGVAHEIREMYILLQITAISERVISM